MYDIREYVAHLHGEGADASAVERTSEDLGLFEIESPEEVNVTINTSNGKLICSKPSLIRRFHFFGDFFSSFPDSKSVDVPFATDEVLGSIYLDNRDESLAHCLRCMKYLNPKRDDEYFQFDSLGDISDDDLMELTNNLSEDDVANMIEAREIRLHNNCSYVPLPRGGRDRPALACILEVFDDERLARMFSDYPSYLVCILGDRDILLNADFSKSDEYSPIASDLVLSRILTVIRYSENKNEITHLVSMLHPYRHGDAKRVIAPYHSEYCRGVVKRISDHPGVIESLKSVFTLEELRSDLILCEIFN